MTDITNHEELYKPICVRCDERGDYTLATETHDGEDYCHNCLINRAMAPLILPRNCANCEHFDGDGYCSLREAALLIRGYVNDPKRVVCELHTPKERSED